MIAMSVFLPGVSIGATVDTAGTIHHHHS